MDEDAQTRASILPAEPVLGLRILAHPDLTRVGAFCAPFAGELSRLTPSFSDGPLATLHVSRTPLALEPHGRGVRLLASAPAKVAIEGTPLEGERELSAAALRSGVVLTLGRAVALWLGRCEQGAAPHLEGFVGTSAAVSALKRRLAQLAPSNQPVLLLGPAGSGKRAAAHVLHALSPRAARPLTGGVDDDTPYIPELCALDATQQAALVARLGRGRVIAGCAHDSPLRGHFPETLRLPALHERPEDIAPLFVHFVLQALAGRARPSQEPLVPAGLIAPLVRAPWRANARELRAYAQAYVLANYAQPKIDLAQWLGALPSPRRASGLTSHELEVAWAANDHDLERAATQLGVSPRSLLLRLRKLGLHEPDSG